MTHPVELELQAATKLNPQVGERRAAFLHRLLAAGQDLTNAQWNKLSPDGQRWYNDAIKDYNLHNDPNDIKDFGPAQPEPAAAAETAAEPGQENWEDERRAEDAEWEAGAPGEELPSDPDDNVPLTDNEIPYEDDEPTQPAPEPTPPPASAAKPPRQRAPRGPAAAKQTAAAAAAPAAAKPPKPATKPGSTPKPAGGKPKGTAAPAAQPAAAQPAAAQPATRARPATAAPAPRQQLNPTPASQVAPPLQPARAPNNSGVSTMVKRLLLRNMDMTNAELLEKVRAQGADVSEASIASLRSEFRHTLRVLQDAGHAKEIKV